MFKIGDKVWSRVYGFAVVDAVCDDAHVSISVPNDDSFVVNIYTIQKMLVA